MNTDARQRDPLPTPAEIAKLPPDGGPEFNRLIHERSPYLLQHARNPVDWFPWGEEAFAKARKENKTIFLSVGYSSCHWCHVMEHESFEHDEIAKLLNELFVPVKVDREERPDIDDIYMVATQLMTGRGGWPNSLWLMPDGRPWYAGTYFPREDRLGQTGFKSLLVNLAQVWTNRPRDIEEQAKQLSDAIRENASLTNAPYQGPMDGLLSNAVARLAASYDATHGGFGGAPKFPPHSTLALLLHLHATRGDETALKLATGTLDAMHLGGIHDHVGGGFHRYATDERWFLPHFEKMLYDNAQLARVYATAFAQTGRADYRDTTAALCDWILRDMADAAGGFHSALDADSEGEEGKFYVWSRAEILQVLGPDDGALFCRVYDITDAGNYFEEATRKATALNIPWLKRLPAGNELKPLAAARGKLRDVRARRVWPMRDDKVLAAWNGLMVGGLAVAGRHLQEERYVRAATKAADFLLGTMTTSDGRLLRSYRAGRASIDGYLDDYAFVADGLLDLADTTGEAKWRDAAARLATTMLARFHDPERGGFFTTSDRHERLIVRHKDAFDQAAPSGNAIAIRVLLRLADAKNGYRDLAAATLRNNGELMRRAPSGTSALLHGLALLEASASARDPAVVASADHECLRAELFLAATAVSAGGTITGRVVLTMAESFHVNANPAGPDLIPTTLALAANKGLSLAPMTYPDGGTNRIYAGRTELPIHLRIDPAAPAGPITFELLVTAQPCDETSCRAPVTLSLKASLKVDAKRDE